MTSGSRFADLVAASAAVAATGSRTAKVAALAGALAALAADEIEAAVAWLAGEPRQGRIGTGWRTLAALVVPPAPEPTLTITEVDRALGRIAACSGAGSAGRRGGLLRELFGAATAQEQRFLVRLITGELRQGALEGVLVEAVAVAGGLPAELVRRAVMLSGELPGPARAALVDGPAALASVRPRLGRGIRPMLASPAASLAEAISELGDVAVDYKMDGARLQLHRDGERVWLFTRGLREITASAPEIVELARALPCRSVVLDGESLALTDEGRPRPFQESMSNAQAALRRPRFFDCLHLDGVDLLDRPLRERLGALDSVAGEYLMPGVRAATEPQAQRLLARALDEGHEGVMVKALDAPYAAGRRGRAWQKVKPAHTLDLVVLAAEWGYGRRTGLLSNIHLGARDPRGGPPIMVGKTFKGMTDAMLEWQTQRFTELADGSTDGYVVKLRPEQVVEIAFDGVQGSTRYPGGMALRFARVLRYRDDKGPAQADTIETVRRLYERG